VINFQGIKMARQIRIHEELLSGEEEAHFTANEKTGRIVGVRHSGFLDY
jgi:hypothetical protein